MTKYQSCTEYWLDPEKLVMRGEFEEMYRDVPDPWGCNQNALSRNNRIFLEILFPPARTFKSFLDIGCGMGSFTNEIYKRNGGAGWGIDVSQTAIQRAAEKYHHIDFCVHNILEGKFGNLSCPYELVVMNEILWYLLDDIEGVLKNIRCMISVEGLLGIHQYFPSEQRFGRDVVAGVEHFLEILSRQFKIMDQVVAHHEHEGHGQVLMATFIPR